MTNLEDEVISVVAQSLRARMVPILAEGGNQMRAFRFVTSSGRRKAPDLVFALDKTLFVWEAKVRPDDLLRASTDGISDLAAMREAQESSSICADLITEGTSRLAACGRSSTQIQSIRFGVIAVGESESVNVSAREVGLYVISVNPIKATWTIVGDTPWPTSTC